MISKLLSQQSKMPEANRGELLMFAFLRQSLQMGKYAALGLVLLAALPILVPSFFIISVFITTFLLPCGCGIAGLRYIKNLAASSHRQVDISSSVDPCSDSDECSKHSSPLVSSTGPQLRNQGSDADQVRQAAIEGVDSSDDESQDSTQEGKNEESSKQHEVRRTHDQTSSVGVSADSDSEESKSGNHLSRRLAYAYGSSSPCESPREEQTAENTDVNSESNEDAEGYPSLGSRTTSPAKVKIATPTRRDSPGSDAPPMEGPLKARQLVDKRSMNAETNCYKVPQQSHVSSSSPGGSSARQVVDEASCSTDCQRNLPNNYVRSTHTRKDAELKLNPDARAYQPKDLGGTLISEEQNVPMIHSPAVEVPHTHHHVQYLKDD